MHTFLVVLAVVRPPEPRAQPEVRQLDVAVLVDEDVVCRKIPIIISNVQHFLRHLGCLEVKCNPVIMFFRSLRSFWWLNELSMSSIKRDIGRGSLRKVMILRAI